MIRRHFGLLLAVLGLVVATVAFGVTWTILDDGQPDSPPRSASRGGDALGSDPAVTTTSTTGPATPGGLETPAWVAVVASEADEADATSVAQSLTAAGHPSGVLRSDDYPSLAKGLWVAYAGPFPDRPTAEAAVADLAADGFDGAYARCAGTTQECDPTS